MVIRVSTVAFEGIETRPVDVQVQISNGNVVFNVVGLGDKAVAEFAGKSSFGAGRVGTFSSRQTHNGQSGAGRYAKRRQPLRFADSPGRHGGDRRDPFRCT